MNLFVRLTKVNEGDHLIEGVATAEEKDRSGETMDYQSSKPFFERWRDAILEATDGKSQGNIREQHDSEKAVGKVIRLIFDDVNKQIRIVAKIVDQSTWGKILDGVLSGFSIAGKYVRRWTDADVTRFTVDPCEISVVDFPALPSATFDVISKSGAVSRRNFKGVSLTMNPDHVRHCLAAATLHDGLAESTTKEATGLRKAAAECDKRVEMHKSQAATLRKMAESPSSFGEVADQANDDDDDDRKAAAARLKKSIARFSPRDPSGGLRAALRRD